MPTNLLSFCLGATYNVLPSPSNLKRWHLASESRCFFCHKDVCTIPHILGACKLSLQQGRFTFGHDNILQDLVLVLKSFLKDLPNITTKKCNTIKFVKSGERYSSPGFRLDSSCWCERWLCVSILISTYRIAPRYCLIFKNLKVSSPVGIDLALWREYAELALLKIK